MRIGLMTQSGFSLLSPTINNSISYTQKEGWNWQCSHPTAQPSQALAVWPAGACWCAAHWALSPLCSCPQTSTAHLGSFAVVSAPTSQFKFLYITYILKVIDFTMEMALVDILTECFIFCYDCCGGQQWIWEMEWNTALKKAVNFWNLLPSLWK